MKIYILKAFLLGLFGLPFVISKKPQKPPGPAPSPPSPSPLYGICEDNPNFKWDGNSGTMDCVKLAKEANKKQICGDKNKIKAGGFELRARVKCRKTCNDCKFGGCVQGSCKNDDAFRWEENGKKVGCSFILEGGDKIRRQFCEKEVDSVGTQKKGKFYLEDKCAKACRNCCGQFD